MLVLPSIVRIITGVDDCRKEDRGFPHACLYARRAWPRSILFPIKYTHHREKKRASAPREHASGNAGKNWQRCQAYFEFPEIAE